MLFFSGNITEDVTNNPVYQKKVEEFVRRTGIHIFPTFTPPHRNYFHRFFWNPGSGSAGHLSSV